MRGRDSARAGGIRTITDHVVIPGSRKIRGIFIFLGDPGRVIPHKEHSKLLTPF